MKKYLLPLSILSLFTVCIPLQANPFTWTGEGEDGNWTNLSNWDPAPDFSAPNSTQNGYIYNFDYAVEMDQNLGGSTRRVGTINFNTGNFNLSSTGRIVFGSGAGGINVTSGDHTITVDQFDINIFIEKSSGGFSVNDGSLTLTATTTSESGGFNLGGSQHRYFSVDGNGVITLNGKLVSGDNGASIRLRNTFTGKLILNTAGSPIADGGVELQGTGTLVVGADDALGSLVLKLEGAAAGIESGNGSRVLLNDVQASDGKKTILKGSDRLELAGDVLLNGSHTFGVEESENTLVLSGVVSGSSGDFYKEGAGVLMISGDNSASWTQSLNIHGGTLLIHNTTGSATGSGAVYITSGATLDGEGRIAGDTIITEGMLALSEEGVLSLGSLYLEDATILLREGSLAAMVEEGITFSGNVKVHLDENAEWIVGETYRLFNLDGGSITGTLAMDGAYQADFDYQSGSGGYVDFTLTAIPEPGVLAFMISVGLLGVIRMKRFQSRQQA